MKNLKSFGPDIVFNALHGRFGEDGYIQRILEFNKVKYTHSGVLSSALAMDKVASKKLFIKNGIQTPKFLVIKNNFQNLIRLKYIIKKKLNFPIVIKAINEGVDVFICNDRNLKNLTKLKDIKKSC